MVANITDKVKSYFKNVVGGKNVYKIRNINVRSWPITALENKSITIKQFDNRIKRLNKLRDDLKEKEQEFINEMWEQEREVQQDMSRGGL